MPDDDRPLRVPVAEEQMMVDRRERTGSVRVHTRVEVRDEHVETELTREQVDVRRVPIGRYVDEAEPVREEGDTTIVPVYEEVLVVEKRLLLREELHLTKRSETRPERQRVRLRREHADIERDEPDG